MIAGPVVVAVLGIAFLLAVVVVGRPGGDRKKRGARGASWADGRELAQLHIKAPEPGRLTLGRHRGRLLAAEPRTSTMVVAPSQSGKTTGLVVPALLEWHGPAIATSVKGDLLNDTLSARRRHGEVRLFDPTDSTGLGSAAWSPVAASGTWEASRRTAARLLEIGERHANSADETFWRPAGAAFLAPFLFAGAHRQAGMGEVLGWIARDHRDVVTGTLGELDDAGVPGAAAAHAALESVWNADHRFSSSVRQTVLTALDAWQEPRVSAATDPSSGSVAITADWLLEGDNTLYLCAPASDQRRLRGLFSALVADVVATAFERSARTGRPIDPALLLCLDEAANVAPLPNLDEIASTGPGQGVQVLSVWQNLSQLTDVYGRDRADTIVANHRARLFGSGIADRATLEYLGAVLGDELIERESSTRRRAEPTANSHTRSEEYRRLATPDRVRQTDQDTALLLYGRLRPAWIELRPWYRDGGLQAQVQPPPTPAATVQAAGR